MDEFGEFKSRINLRNINSSYIIQKMFSYIYEKQKLMMIMHNKELQKICLVDIGNYKKISGKYRIGGKNGKGKEYIIDTNKKIFEGKYLNGKRWNGNGYNINGNIEFQIKEGKGNIKEYNDYGNLEFEGE